MVHFNVSHSDFAKWCRCLYFVPVGFYITSVTFRVVNVTGVNELFRASSPDNQSPMGRKIPNLRRVRIHLEPKLIDEM